MALDNVDWINIKHQMYSTQHQGDSTQNQDHSTMASTEAQENHQGEDDQSDAQSKTQQAKEGTSAGGGSTQREDDDAGPAAARQAESSPADHSTSEDSTTHRPPAGGPPVERPPTEQHTTNRPPVEGSAAGPWTRPDYPPMFVYGPSPYGAAHNPNLGPSYYDPGSYPPEAEPGKFKGFFRRMWRKLAGDEYDEYDDERYMYDQGLPNHPLFSPPPVPQRGYPGPRPPRGYPPMMEGYRPRMMPPDQYRAGGPMMPRPRMMIGPDGRPRGYAPVYGPPGMAPRGMLPPGMAPPAMAPPGMVPPGMLPPGMVPPGMGSPEPRSPGPSGFEGNPDMYDQPMRFRKESDQRDEDEDSVSTTEDDADKQTDIKAEVPQEGKQKDQDLPGEEIIKKCPKFMRFQTQRFIWHQLETRAICEMCGRRGWHIHRAGPGTEAPFRLERPGQWMVPGLKWMANHRIKRTARQIAKLQKRMEAIKVWEEAIEKVQDSYKETPEGAVGGEPPSGEASVTPEEAMGGAPPSGETTVIPGDGNPLDNWLLWEMFLQKMFIEDQKEMYGLEFDPYTGMFYPSQEGHHKDQPRPGRSQERRVSFQLPASGESLA